MKQLTFIFLSLFFILFYHQAIAQIDPNAEIDYEIIIREGDHKTFPVQLLGIDNNEAFIAYSITMSMENGDTVKYVLAHVNDRGEIDNKIDFPANIYSIGKMNASDSYLLMGCKHLKEELAFLICVFKFNKELEIEWEKVIDTMRYAETTKYPDPEWMLIRFWNNTYYLSACGQLMKSDPYQRGAIYKMDAEGNILLKKDFYPQYVAAEIRYISHIPGTNRFLMNPADGQGTDYRTWIMNDENLEKVSEFVLPVYDHPLADDLDMEYINETEFIYSGLPLGFGSGNRHMGLRKGSVSKPIIKTRFWQWDNFNGPIGCRSGWIKSMAMQNNYFYYGITDQMYNKTNNLIITAFNYDLDSLWTAYLKDDSDYWISSITPMTDGSCLMSARRFFYDDYNNVTCDAYFVKIKTPEVLKNLVVAEHKELPAIEVYPNPTSGELHVTSDALHVTGVEVFDLIGRKQKAESRKGEEEKGEMVIDISGLPVGVYLLKINTDAGEVVKKVVKY